MRICFVAPHAYAALSGRADLPPGGGAEVQQVIVSRELARRGWHVSAVTLDMGQADGVVHQGVTIWKFCARKKSRCRPLRTWSKWRALWRAMERADADIYYQRAAGSETGLAALWCQWKRKKFVFATASDTNCIAALPDLRSLGERILYRAGLRMARKIICQTRGQAAALGHHFGVSSTVIRNCTPDPYPGVKRLVRPRDQGPQRILWVGRLSPKKRPDWFLDLAESCPKLRFDFVGGGKPGDPYADPLVRRAAQIPNVVQHGWIPLDRMGEFYEGSALLVCTSSAEGFPNTFLEAWARGVPTVSTVDPDQTIESEGLGMVGRTFAELRASLLSLAESPKRLEDCGVRARNWYSRNHSIARCVSALERELVGGDDAADRTGWPAASAHRATAQDHNAVRTGARRTGYQGSAEFRGASIAEGNDGSNAPAVHGPSMGREWPK